MGRAVRLNCEGAEDLGQVLELEEPCNMGGGGSE